MSKTSPCETSLWWRNNKNNKNTHHPVQHHQHNYNQNYQNYQNYQYHSSYQHQLPFEQHQHVVKVKLRVCCWNFMRDFLHNNIPCYKWSEREPRILATILDINADIYAFQECIDLGPEEPIIHFLEKLKPLGYDYQVHYDQHQNNQKVLRVVNAWKSSILEVLPHESFTFWLSPNYHSSKPARREWGQKIARPIGVNHLMHVESGAKICIWNTHFGHSSMEKLESANKITHIMQENVHWSSSVILMGDFNTFSGGDGSDVKIRNIICTGNPLFQFQDLGQQSRTVVGNLQQTGTFVGTSTDPHRPPIGEIGDRLDHMFTRNISLIKPVLVWNKSYLPKDRVDPTIPCPKQYDIYPSDHLALVADIAIDVPSSAMSLPMCMYAS